MLKLRIVSPERVVFDGEVSSVDVPGTVGRFQILNNHAPIISSLTEGTVEYATVSGVEHIEVAGGFVAVNHNEVNLCVEM